MIDDYDVAVVSKIAGDLLSGCSSAWLDKTPAMMRRAAACAVHMAKIIVNEAEQQRPQPVQELPRESAPWIQGP